MSLPAALDLLSGFQPFAALPAHEQSRVAALLRPVQLRPGTRLHDFNELPAVVLLQEGQLRVLAQDSRGESFTLERVDAGALTGWLPLLRGVPGQVVAAAQPSRAWLLPADDFLELHRRHGAVREFCRQGGVLELMAVATADLRPDLLRDAALRDWARQADPQQALLLDGPRAQVPDGHWLLSSGAVEDQSVGAALEGGAVLQLKGLLPARLLPRPEAWPPLAMAPAGPLAAATTAPEVIEPEWVEGSELVPQLRQAEALQDWYGRLGDDGSFPQVEGSGPLDEPFACLRMLARSFDLPFRRDIVRRILEDQLQRSEGKGITQLQLAAVCDLLGLSASLLEVDPAQVHRLPTPAVLMQDAAHPVVLWSAEGGSLLLGDPRQGQRRVPRGQLDPFLGENGRLPVLCLQRSTATPKARFGLGWFLPAIRQHRGILTQVLVASFFVQLFALLNPLLIQQIIDAVISQGNLRSLNVLGTLLVAMAIAEALLGSLRTYLFSDTTNRIDISLGSSIIDHLLRLPLGYFARRPVGEVASRINELERIRRFLTGTALTVVLDAVFSVIYIAVMLLYSPLLTLWALAVVPFFIGLTAAASPVIRRQLREQAEANARVQSHLVETLGGMETVKGQGMELHSRWRWQQLYGGQIAAGFRNTVTSTAAGSASHFFEQLSGLLVLWVGAGLVLQGKLTLGQLIAFRILSGYVTSPLLRLATLWQSFQETALSLERLSDIVDHPQELEIAGAQLPPLPPSRGASATSGSTSASAVADRCNSSTLISTSRPAASSASPAAAALARAPCSSCSPGSTTPSRARSAWMGMTSPRLICIPCVARSVWCPRTACCSTEPSRKTSPSPGRMPISKRSWRRPRWPVPMTSSSSCPPATAPRWGSGVQVCRAARGNAWPSPGWCLSNHGCWCSTRPPAPSMSTPSSSSPATSARPTAAARCCSSPTASAPFAMPTASS